MPNVTTGTNPQVDDGAVLGREYDDDAGPTRIGDRATIRSGTVVYADVEIGDDFSTGHHALVREHTRVGDDVLVGTSAVLDGHVTVGSHVSIQTRVYVPPDTRIGTEVFLGPAAVLTNDGYPVRTDEELDGPTIEDHVSVGANATILPGVHIGCGSFVAAGAVVTKDVPPETLAIGSPAEHRPLPEDVDAKNDIG